MKATNVVKLRPTAKPVAAKPARPKAVRGGHVEVMLNAARDVLAEEGHRGFTLRKIAERSGVSLGTLTYHFKDRASLIDGICRRHEQRWRAAIQQWSEGPPLTGSPEAFLELILDQHLNERFLERAYRFDAELWAMSMRSDDAWAVLQNAAGGMADIYVDAILKIVPDLPHAVAASRATLILTLIEGLPIFSRADRGNVDAAKLKAEVRDLVLLLVKQPTPAG